MPPRPAIRGQAPTDVESLDRIGLGCYRQTSMTFLSAGGIYNNGGGVTMTLTNVSVSGNTAVVGLGGGINNNGTLIMRNGTIRDNKAARSGGGISNFLFAETYLLAGTMGNLDNAVDHFQGAYDFCRKAGYGPELGWTCHDYANALTKRNNAGDRARALGLLDEALSISEELGMRPLAEQVSTLKDLADSRPARPPAYPDGLSQREVEVIRLIAAGRTDREIAEELIIAVRTVATHVGNILNKTGAANRAEAASYANQRGLVTSTSDGED